MHRVVYNNCYGGFSLSLEAVDWLAKNATDSVLKQFIQKAYVNTNQRYLGYTVGDWFDDKRHHKDLIELVESIGSDRASGDCAKLDIDYISGNQYRIKKYDGAEEIITPDNDDPWITIKD